MHVKTIFSDKKVLRERPGGPHGRLGGGPWSPGAPGEGKKNVPSLRAQNYGPPLEIGLIRAERNKPIYQNKWMCSIQAISGFLNKILVLEK